jgi:hypothetical protein
MASHSNIPDRLLHGTHSTGLSRFDTFYSAEGRPFGPAIYLTTDIDVAKCYSGPKGVVLQVDVEGQLTRAINLDRSIVGKPSA